MSIEPTPGLVVRYDFLWDNEHSTGREEGMKDRPCSIVVAAPKHQDGSRSVWLCAITHSPPTDDQTAVEIPPQVARHLGLDAERSWIKTHEINSLTWERGRIPHGITRALPGQWTFGYLPQKLGKEVFAQIQKNYRARTLAKVQRDLPDSGGTV